MKRILSFSSLIALITLLMPSLAEAHTGTGTAHDFSHGFSHPLGGFDHLLAMIAVGLWAAQMGGRAIWAVPASFVSIMVLGGILGISGIEIPLIEQGIISSVLILGVLIAASVRLPLAASIALVGLFAIFHGHAHGTEMPETASGLTYAFGFILATSLLHLGGIAMGLTIQKAARPSVVRWAGATVALAGLYLAVS